MTDKILVRLNYRNGFIDLITLPKNKVVDVEVIDYEAIPFIFKELASDQVVEFYEAKTLSVIGGEIVD